MSGWKSSFERIVRFQSVACVARRNEDSRATRTRAGMRVRAEAVN